MALQLPILLSLRDQELFHLAHLPLHRVDLFLIFFLIVSADDYALFYASIATCDRPCTSRCIYCVTWAANFPVLSSLAVPITKSAIFALALFGPLLPPSDAILW